MRAMKWILGNGDLILSAVWIGLGVKVGLIDNVPGALFAFGIFGLNFYRVHLWKAKLKRIEKMCADQTTYIKMLHCGQPIECNGINCHVQQRNSTR